MERPVAQKMFLHLFAFRITVVAVALYRTTDTKLVLSLFAVRRANTRKFAWHAAHSSR